MTAAVAIPKIYTEQQISSVVKLDQQLVSVIEDAYIALNSANSQMPPIQQLNLPWVAGQLSVKSAANA
ncbi:MAG: hypothetical protein HRU04_08075 [Oceanospirillaceae bacterium]|nr:hypothetical protein [Oceanospirillaceae bacterium]